MDPEDVQDEQESWDCEDRLQQEQEQDEEDPTIGMDLFEEQENKDTQTVLNGKFSFWYMRRGTGPKTNYEDNIHKISSFQTVEYFWRIYDHLLKPDNMKQTIDYHLFKEGIKPTWEHPANVRGGKWMIRLRKGLGSRCWEELVLGLIGEQFDVGNEICGAVISIRAQEDILSVWNRNSENTDATAKIRDQLRRLLKLPHHVTMEYKKHQDSIVDKSSFRNTATFRTTGRWGGPQTKQPRTNDDGTDDSGLHKGGVSVSHSSAHRDKDRDREGTDKEKAGRHVRHPSSLRPGTNGRKEEGSEDAQLEWNRRGKDDHEDRRGFKRFQDSNAGPGAASNWERPSHRRYQHSGPHAHTSEADGAKWSRGLRLPEAPAAAQAATPPTNGHDTTP